MCGIAGLYSLRPGVDRASLPPIVTGMTDTIAHRGPDSEGLWQDPDHPAIVLGHRRLAILDLSPLGHQPMESPSGRYWCVYNGEIYNYQDIEAQLKTLGHSFKGRSDTEVFLTALDQWGLNLVCQKIIGMYAFIIWDRKERVIHLMRDRLGKKPLYVGWAGQDLVMGSELKALCAHPGFKRELNLQTLRSYMTYGYVHAPGSIYRNVWTVPPGARMTLRTETLTAGEDLGKRIEYYWDLPRVVTQAAAHRRREPDQDLINEFDCLLGICVKERMISDVSLGAFLSGGIDSSAVVALMQAQSGVPVKTYAIGFDNPAFNEAPHAKEIASYLGTEHHELLLTDQDALAVVPRLSDIYDEPFADISQIPTCLVAAFARQDVTVALSGDGGDEMLGGYNRHTLVPRIWNRMKFIPAPLRRALSKGITSLTQDQWERLFAFRNQQGQPMQKLAGILRQNSPLDMYEYLTSSNPEGGRLVLGDGEPQPSPIRDIKGFGISEHMMFRDTLSYLPNDILVKVDRAAMAVSLEARAPLLDSRIAEFVWTLPVNLKIRNNQGKWLLRQVLKKYVPEHLFNRPKSGFSPPINEWLRNGLKDWAGDLLSTDKVRREGILDADAIDVLWQSHLQKKTNAGPALWTILMFQSWMSGRTGP
jgi:asparagine synthase (glutamine-hydrolysing)